ncbi:hypothetical protein D0U04_12190 [Bacillus clarus]|nr:hypothetical protein [Bacillus clarus]RFT66667.1 hypothetical protein D0U04_12190 [Bacillus clarus]
MITEVKSKHFKLEETDLGTKISLRDIKLHNKIPNPIFLLLERMSLGMFFVPFTSIQVSFGLSYAEYVRVTSKYCKDVSEMDLVDPDNFAIPYPSVGALKVNFIEGITFKFSNERDKEYLIKKMDKSLDRFLNQ